MNEMFIIAVTDILGFSKPVEIRIHPQNTNLPKTERELAGWCDTFLRKGRITKHVLHINLRVCIESEYSITDTIAHEMVHAIMIENGKFNEEKHHDTRFQNICTALENNMRELGFEIGTLYNPETDTD